MKYELFNIVLHSPMGPKKGTLKIFKTDDVLSGIITILGYDNRFGGVSTEDNKYAFFVKIRSPVGDIPCSVTGQIKDKRLIAVANTSKGVMKLTGTKIDKDMEAPLA
nr:hypothetical protein [Sedimentibacter sp.]